MDLPKEWSDHNAASVKKIDNALALYDEPNIVDLLADILHYCHASKIDFTNLLADAFNHFTAEIEGRI